MLSRRLPPDRSPNPLAALLAERRASGAPLLDLTESNPTRVGLTVLDAADRAALVEGAAAPYEPDPRGATAARTAIAAYYGARGSSVSLDDLVLTASTSEAYAHLFRLLADPGQAVLVPAPSYPLVEPLAALEGLRVLPYRLFYHDRWQVDVASFEEAASRPGARVAVIVHPNNPTGSCVTPTELEAVERASERHGLALLSDEVFGDFPFPPRAALPSALGERRVPTFVLGGLSKTCGLPQMKLAWIALAGPAAARSAAREGLEWITDLFLSVASPVQHALPRLLAARHAFQARVVARTAANRAALAALATARPTLDVLDADGGWSAVLRVPQTRTDQDWALALLERGVLVHPGHYYDFAEDGHLVVSLLPDARTFTAGLSVLETLLSD